MAPPAKSVPNPGDFVPFERNRSGGPKNWVNPATGEVVSNRTIANSKHGGLSIEAYRDRNKVEMRDVRMVFKAGRPEERVAIVGDGEHAVTSKAALKRAILAMDPSRKGRVTIAVQAVFVEGSDSQGEVAWRSFGVDTASMLRWLREPGSLHDALTRSPTASVPAGDVYAIQVREGG